MSIDGYRVIFEKYAERHFVKVFEKKYKKQWLLTRRALVTELRNIDMLVENRRTNPPIHMSADRTEWLLKHEFVVAGQRISRKASGCRLIAYVNEAEKVVKVLLVYHKDDLPKGSGETNTWQNMIRAEYGELLKGLSF